MSDLFVPPDNEAMRTAYQAESGGSCGPAAIATLSRKTVQDILKIWPIKYPGHAPMKLMGDVLTKLGYSLTHQRGNKAHIFPEPPSGLAIVRIQWLKEDGTEYYWRAATKYTHYVLLRKIGERWLVFCNGYGWFERDSELGKNYLKLGYISSYYEIETGRTQTIEGFLEILRVKE